MLRCCLSPENLQKLNTYKSSAHPAWWALGEVARLWLRPQQSCVYHQIFRKVTKTPISLLAPKMCKQANVNLAVFARTASHNFHFGTIVSTLSVIFVALTLFAACYCLYVWSVRYKERQRRRCAERDHQELNLRSFTHRRVPDSAQLEGYREYFRNCQLSSPERFHVTDQIRVLPTPRTRPTPPEKYAANYDFSPKWRWRSQKVKSWFQDSSWRSMDFNKGYI